MTELLISFLQITYQEFLPSVLGTRTWKAAGLEIPLSEQAQVSGVYFVTNYLGLYRLCKSYFNRNIQCILYMLECPLDKVEENEITFQLVPLFSLVSKV